MLSKKGINKEKTVCDRCGANVALRIGANRLYPHDFVNGLGEKVHMDRCWDCDWDVMNGGDPFEDASSILYDRSEEEIGYDQ
jgi:hypothetical protein